MKRTRYMLLVALVLGLWAGWSAVVWAGDDAQARTKYYIAEKLLARGDAEGAIAALDEAKSLLGETNPKIQVLLAKACKQAGRFDRALTEIKTYFKVAPETGDETVESDEMCKLQADIEIECKDRAAAKSRAEEAAANAARAAKTDFFACGKEWKVGPNNLNWDEAQEWINSLGGGWHTPTLAELKQLYAEVGKNSPIGSDFVWGESRDSSSAWYLDFRDGSEYWRYRDYRFKYLRVVAVRSRR